MKKRLISITETLDKIIVSAAKEYGLTVTAQISTILQAWAEKQKAAE